MYEALISSPNRLGMRVGHRGRSRELSHSLFSFSQVKDPWTFSHKREKVWPCSGELILRVILQGQLYHFLARASEGRFAFLDPQLFNLPSFYIPQCSITSQRILCPEVPGAFSEGASHAIIQEELCFPWACSGNCRNACCSAKWQFEWMRWPAADLLPLGGWRWDWV